MREKSTKKEHKPDFKSLIPEYDDQEIMEILKKRSYYQPEAADLAVKEAIKRGLIYSEQDLFAEEFQVEPMRFKLFPTIEKEHQKNKIRQSIARMLVITGILPTVWGIVRIVEGVKMEGIILIVLGAIWIFLSSRIFRKTEPKIIRTLFGLLVISLFYIIYVFIGFKGIIFMDVFAPAFLYGLIVYGLLFLLRMRR